MQLAHLNNLFCVAQLRVGFQDLLLENWARVFGQHIYPRSRRSLGFGSSLLLDLNLIQFLLSESEKPSIYKKRQGKVKFSEKQELSFQTGSEASIENSIVSLNSKQFPIES